MREPLRLSTKTWGVVTVTLALVVLAWTVDSARKAEVFNSDMHLVANMVAKDLDPALFSRDYFLADDRFYRFYTPFYRWLLARLWQVTGSFEAGLVWLTPITLSVYLAGMFILLRRVIGNTWLALSLAVVSASYQFSLGEEIWGVAGSSHLLARTLFVAVVPYLFGLFLATLENPTLLKGGMLGVGIGLAANLHPTSGLHLAILLGSLFFLASWLHRHWRYWQILGVLFLGILLGAWPTAGNFVVNSDGTAPAGISFDSFSRTLGLFYSIPFSPAEIKWPLLGLTLKRPWLDGLGWGYFIFAGLALPAFWWGRRRWPALVRWGWLIGGLVIVWYAYLLTLFNLPLFFGLITFYVIYHFRRGSIRPVDGWLITLTGLIVLSSFVAYYLMMLLWQRFELWTLTALFVQQLRSARFVYLPVYLLTGLAAQDVVDLLKNEVTRLRPGLGSQAHPSLENLLSLAVGLLLILSPGLSRQWGGTAVIILGIIIGIIALLIFLEKPGLKQLLPWWPLPAAAAIVLVLFGPLAPLAAPYLTLPAVNLFDPQARRSEHIWHEEDAELYRWVKQHTAPDVLFYWCDFGPITTLNFRRQAQRGITHNWKDLNLMSFNTSAFVPAFERYRGLEAACSDLATATRTAHQLKADFILASAKIAAGLEGESCFANGRYLVFPGSAERCP
ncbi:MAG: hypothetical protein KJ077_44430 [Anaerolineae bacterium]|nr:hypothetical protein [Anaerolineae bacterium]